MMVNVFLNLSELVISFGFGLFRDISFLYDVAFADKTPGKVDPSQDASSVRALVKQSDKDQVRSGPISL